MENTVTPARTFIRSLRAVTMLWFGTSSGYTAATILCAAVFYLQYGTMPLMLDVGMTLAITVFAMGFMLVFQAWRITRWWRSAGRSVYVFAPDSATCEFGSVVSRVPWSAVSRIRLTRSTFFIYVTPKAAWHLARNELGTEDEARVLGFARHWNVTVVGGRIEAQDA